MLRPSPSCREGNRRHSSGPAVTLESGHNLPMLRTLTLGIMAGLVLYSQVAIEPRPKPVTKQEPRAQPTLRVDTTLVLVPVTVNDPLNRPVAGLEKENFRVLDNKVEQTITQFA